MPDSTAITLKTWAEAEVTHAEPVEPAEADTTEET